MKTKLLEWYRILGGFRYYVLTILLCFGGFVWTELNGHRLLGDDVNERESHTGRRGQQHFFHK